MVDTAGYITSSILYKAAYYILNYGRQENVGKLILFLTLFYPTTLSLRPFIFSPSLYRLTSFILSLFVFLSSSILLIYSFVFSFHFFRAVFLALFPSMSVAVKGLRNKGQKGLEKRKALDRSKCELAPRWSEGYLQDGFVVRQEHSTSIHPQLPATGERIR
jgi:hypothetical protein